MIVFQFSINKINKIIRINADLDDLKIYNTTLSDEEICNLYNTSKQSLNLVVTDSKENIIIKKDNDKTNSDAITSITKSFAMNPKKIEVFSQCQKVLSNNTQEININQLPEGTYLLKVTSLSSKKNTSK